MYSPVSVAMAGCSEGGTAMSGRARALNESNPAHSNLAPTVAATLTPCHFSLQQNYYSLTCTRSLMLFRMLQIRIVLFLVFECGIFFKACFLLRVLFSVNNFYG